MPPFPISRLAVGARPVLLDGPTGTELGRSGVDLSLPGWSASAVEMHPEIVRWIHVDYLDAGAEILTANTFRTTPRALRHAGEESPDLHAEQLTAIAVQLAREAIAERGRESNAFVAGALAPLEDCYRPDLVPSIDDLRREHSAQVGFLARAGVDLVLVETMNTLREAAEATRAATAAGLPAWTSFVVGPGGKLLSGEPIEEAARAAIDAGAGAVLVNCSSLDDTGEAVVRLAGLSVPFGAYANAGQPTATSGAAPILALVDPAEYAARAREWLDLGAWIVGSCCGTGAPHIAALARLLDERPGSSPHSG